MVYLLAHPYFLNNEFWTIKNFTRFNRIDIDNVFAYVFVNHPNRGFSSIYQKVDKSMTIEGLSLYADAVTVYCYESVGNNNISDITFNPKVFYNKTS